MSDARDEAGSLIRRVLGAVVLLAGLDQALWVSTIPETWRPWSATWRLSVVAGLELRVGVLFVLLVLAMIWVTMRGSGTGSQVLRWTGLVFGCGLLLLLPLTVADLREVAGSAANPARYPLSAWHLVLHLFGSGVVFLLVSTRPREAWEALAQRLQPAGA